jgi:glycerol kinase
VPVERPACAETTALGAALLAGLGAGLFASSAELSARWRAAGRWEPRWTAAERDEQLAGWRAAVARVRTTA